MRFIKRLLLLAVFIAFIGAGFAYAYRMAKVDYIPLPGRSDDTGRGR